jgi:hypothetical protein
MKVGEAIIGIILIIAGDILFEMNGDVLLGFFGLVLVGVGVSIYLLVVDSLGEKKKKGIKKKEVSQYIHPLK